ncbi:MAG: SufS family cysteine desulfurase [Candidatus Microthrix parvicella]|jgi:cysteine desulfurase/selenocysteine lyase
MSELRNLPGDPLDAVALQRQFPVLQRSIKGHRMAFLDSAASSQKPQRVIDAMSGFYETINANVHRGVYEISEQATNALEGVRSDVARFIGASDVDEVVFTKNATESLNLVAGSWGRANLGPGDAIVLTMLEHHANIVPWQMLASERRFDIRWIPLTEDAQLDLGNLDTLLDGAKLVGLTAASNVTGTLTPVRRIADAAHDAGALVCVDACQYVPHAACDVNALGADFLAFSGHKMCGPTGIGVLWARRSILEDMPPFLGGGSMIQDVRLDGFVPTGIPHRFEAGTPPIAEIIGLGEAIAFLNEVGMEAVQAHEQAMSAYAFRTLTERFGERMVIHGPAEPDQRAGVMSFALGDVHPHDVSQILDEHGVAVRAGHHCAKPLMKALGVGATARASWYLYNTPDDIDALADGLEATARFFL